MTQHLLIVSIGPVQSMIASARKAEDLWSGSYLLSDLIGYTMRTLEKSVGQEQVTWIQPANNKNDPKSDIASNPNRFTCIIKDYNEESLKGKLNQLEVDIREYIVSLSLEAAELMVGTQNITPEIEQQVRNQIYPFLEIFWAFEPYSETEDFTKLRTLVEGNLASVKNSRLNNLSPQIGPVCTMCGQQTALSMMVPDKTFDERQHKEATDRLWQKISNDWRRRDNEYLCSLCTLKRSLRRIRFQQSKNSFPSVRMFASRDLTKTDDMVVRSEEENRYYGVLMFDGDDMGQWMSGKKLETVEGPADLVEISKKLSLFSSKGIQEALTHHPDFVKVIYSGGDDVLAIGSTFDLLDFTYDIYSSFRSSDKGLDPLATASCGFVIAPEKAPLQQIMAYARRAESRAKSFNSPYLKYGKNAFSILFVSGSGEQRLITLPFTVDIKESTELPEWFSIEGKNLLEMMSDWARIMNRLSISRNYINHFSKAFLGMHSHTEHEELYFQSIDEIDMVRSELFRLLQNEKNVHGKDELVLRLANDLTSIYYIYQEDFISYIHFLEILEYFKAFYGKEGQDV